MSESRGTAVAFGPVGIAGWALLILGVILRRRLVAVVGLTAVIADITVAELGGFKAMNEPDSADEPSVLRPE